MRCEEHALATGPDGKCVLCHRREHELARVFRSRRDPWRTIAIVIVAVAAAVATFALTGAWLDTTSGP